MEMPKLTTQEEECYQKIIKDGTMEDMFQVAYAIGRERKAKEQLEWVADRCTVYKPKNQMSREDKTKEIEKEIIQNLRKKYYAFDRNGLTKESVKELEKFIKQALKALREEIIKEVEGMKKMIAPTIPDVENTDDFVEVIAHNNAIEEVIKKLK